MTWYKEAKLNGNSKNNFILTILNIDKNNEKKHNILNEINHLEF